MMGMRARACRVETPLHRPWGGSELLVLARCVREDGADPAGLRALVFAHLGLVGCGERGRPGFYSGCCGKSSEGGRQGNSVGWPLLGLDGEWRTGPGHRGGPS